MRKPRNPGHNLPVPSYQQIRESYERISGKVHRTPVVRSAWYDERYRAKLYFKCENDQKSGSFKYRGALNTILSLPAEELKNGVATHSSGNHGQALALAARMRNVNAVIVMPSNAPAVKVSAVKEYGGEVVFCEPTLESRERVLAEIVAERGLKVVHPYTEPGVICGQATTALEFLEDVPNLDYLLMPVGGGGLISGCSLAVYYTRRHQIQNSDAETAICTASPDPDPSVHLAPLVIGTEPEQAADAFRSFQSGLYQTDGNEETLADGLRATIGRINFTIIRKHVTEIVTVSEEDIIKEMRHFWERMKRVIEPSCAVPLAALGAMQHQITGKRVGVIITGGNVDLDLLPWIIHKEYHQP